MPNGSCKRMSSAEVNTSNVPSISPLVSCCQGLITVEKEALTVHLIHFTLHEYLSARPNIFSRPQEAGKERFAWMVGIGLELVLELCNSRRKERETWDGWENAG